MAVQFEPRSAVKPAVLWKGEQESFLLFYLQICLVSYSQLDVYVLCMTMCRCHWKA